MMCRDHSYSAIAEWGRTCPPELAVALGFTHPKTPCASTFHYCFKDLDIGALEKILSEWAADVFATIDAEDKDEVAIDGKTLCGSLTQDAQITHLLSVMSHQLGIPLTQRSVPDKTNEIPIATRILEAFDVAGKVVTTDALLTQRKFFQDLCDANADYVLPVKDNQRKLLEDIRSVFEPGSSATHTTANHTKTFERTLDDLGAHTDIYSTIEKENGWLQTRTGKKTTMTQYGITSLTPVCGSAERILMLRRGHWTIENLSHHTRDVFFDEDASQVRCGNIPQVMCALRNATFSLLRTSRNTEIAYALRYLQQNLKKH